MFADAVRALFYKPLHDANHMKTFKLFGRYFGLPYALTQALQEAVYLDTEWFAFPMTRNASFLLMPLSRTLTLPFWPFTMPPHAGGREQVLSILASSVESTQAGSVTDSDVPAVPLVPASLKLLNQDHCRPSDQVVSKCQSCQSIWNVLPESVPSP